jgi:hypothetical protein
VQPFHGASFIKELQGTFTPPTVKQHLTALRMLFDRLVTGHVMGANPAHAVRGPKYVVKKGKTPPGFCHYEEDEPRRPAPQRGDWATLPIAMPESLMVATDHTGG